MALKKIVHVETGKVVNLYTANSTGAVANGTRLSLYAWQNNNDQKWQEESKENGASVLMRLARDPSKVMNRHSGNNNAHIWAYDGTAETDKDSLVDTRTDMYGTRICLVKRGLYLTKGAADNFLYWNSKLEAASQRSRQYFKIEDANGDSGGNTGDITPEKSLSIPVVLSQKTHPNTIFQDSGCAVTAGIMAAAFHDGKEYNITSFDNYWNVRTTDYGTYAFYSWMTPKGWSFVEDGQVSKIPGDAQTVEYIKKYIDQGNPPICFCPGRDGHWMLAYGYTSGSTFDAILIYDPADGMKKTLAQGMDKSCGGTSQGITRIKVK